MIKDNPAIGGSRRRTLHQIISGFGVLLLLLLTSPVVLSADRYPNQKIYTSAAFGPDGRLWRLVPSQDHIAVDYSLDYGKTFSKPARVNNKSQRIDMWEENPPTIAVDRDGAVYVLYFADGKQPYTSYFSKSTDGEHFSKPLKVSSKADQYVHYQTEMLVGQDKKVHILWHDSRDEAEYSKYGGGDLSLYYVSAEASRNREFPPDQRIAKNICSCCRTAVALDKDGLPVILARFVYPSNIRDLGMLKLTAEGKAGDPWRVTNDDWQIAGCPTQGPALSISNSGRYHMTWFTQGKARTGLFYAWSDDQGKTFSQPLAFGNSNGLAGNADVFALGNKVAVAWKEFDGENTRVQAMHSEDGGNNWSAPKMLTETPTPTAYPALISDGKRIFLSWNSVGTGYRLIPIE